MSPHPMDPARAPPALLRVGEMGISAVSADVRTHLYPTALRTQ